MKKTLFIITAIFLCIILVLYITLKNIQMQGKYAKNFNLIYEQYIGKNVYGTEIATLINKAVDNNEKFQIEKDENGFYVEDNRYSVKIEIHITINDTTYPMETIYKHGTDQFVQNFNTILFKAKEITYHKETGRIANLLFEQVEE